MVVTETLYTVAGYSLQYLENGVWSGPLPSTFGYLNVDQSGPASGLCASYTPPSPPAPASNAFINEVGEERGGLALMLL